MKTYTGRVVSNKMVKTVIIETTILSVHPLYKKTVRKNRTIKAHTDILLNIGDEVKYISCRPIAKDVHFKVIEKTGV